MKKRKMLIILLTMQKYQFISNYYVISTACSASANAVTFGAELIENGEYDIAIDYLEKAYMASDILSIPEEKYEILFSLAEIYEFQGDFNKMEEYLLLILSKEPMYRNKNRINAILKSVSSPVGQSPSSVSPFLSF